MTEQPIESFETPDVLTDQDRADLEAMWGDAAGDPNFRSVLLVWEEILKPENIEANKGMTMQWATLLCGKYPQVTYADVDALHDWYFEFLEELADLVRVKVAKLREDDGDPLGTTSAEEDVERNRAAYIELLTEWQLALLDRELAWRPGQDKAAAYVAALGEVQQFFFQDGRGLAAHLEVIKLEFTDEDRVALATTLQERQAAAREEEK